MRLSWLAVTAFALAGVGTPTAARDVAATLPVPASGIIGVTADQLTPAYWIARQAQPQRVLLDAAQVAAQNARLLQLDSSMHDLRALPPTLDRAQVTGWIEALSRPPQRPLFAIDGTPVPTATLDALVDQLALERIPAQQKTRYGLLVRRVALRTFPTTLRVFTERGETDIDRFQETAEAIGTPVVIAHTSRDGAWLFVLSPRYAAWVARGDVAEGPAAQVFAYVEHTPYRVVTGADERTVFTPEQPAVSRVQLDPGTRVPVLTDLPPTQPVNGQTPYTTHVLQLPVRANDGSLQFTPALLQKHTDTAAAYLPLNAANIIGQAFKLLGERYGWGGAYGGRDCSSFVADVYAGMGVVMPRNTGRQASSPAFARTLFTASSTPAERLRAAHALQVGDLVYIPGHVLLVLGQVDGQPYVIHDVARMSYRRADGSIARIKLNAVSVTPLLPLLFDDQHTYVERMTSIVRMRR
ncbi:MAG TPA: SH3 domain-containing protein [Rhodanobacter sp.]